MSRGWLDVMARRREHSPTGSSLGTRVDCKVCQRFYISERWLGVTLSLTLRTHTHFVCLVAFCMVDERQIGVALHNNVAKENNVGGENRRADSSPKVKKYGRGQTHFFTDSSQQ